MKLLASIVASPMLSASIASPALASSNPVDQKACLQHGIDMLKKMSPGIVIRSTNKVKWDSSPGPGQDNYSGDIHTTEDGRGYLYWYICGIYNGAILSFQMDIVPY